MINRLLSTLSRETTSGGGSTGGGGGSVVPLLRLLFVDGATASTAQDGSIANPFKTMAAALTAAEAAPFVFTSFVGVLIAPGDYSAETLTYAGAAPLRISAILPGREINLGVLLGHLTISGNDGVGLTGVNVASVDAGSGDLMLDNCYCEGALTAGASVRAFNSRLRFSTVSAYDAFFRQCELTGVDFTIAGQIAQFYGSIWSNAGTAGGSVVFPATGDPKLYLDSLTNWWWQSMGAAASLVNGSLVVAAA